MPSCAPLLDDPTDDHDPPPTRFSPDLDGDALIDWMASALDEAAAIAGKRDEIEDLVEVLDSTLDDETAPALLRRLVHDYDDLVLDAACAAVRRALADLRGRIEGATGADVPLDPAVLADPTALGLAIDRVLVSDRGWRTERGKVADAQARARTLVDQRAWTAVLAADALAGHAAALAQETLIGWAFTAGARYGAAKTTGRRRS